RASGSALLALKKLSLVFLFAFLAIATRFNDKAVKYSLRSANVSCNFSTTVTSFFKS
ncbi:hypothetical protein AVEN_47804-1, partial [Araneus ventricosus]